MGGQQFEYRILGTLEVVRDGQPLPIRSRTQRTLLAGLLMRRGRWVPTDRLRELLGEPAPISRNALHLHIKRLRGVLGAADQIVHRNDGYLMPSGSAATDLARFDALVGRASGAARTGDRDTALARLREAGRLFRRIIAHAQRIREFPACRSGSSTWRESSPRRGGHGLRMGG